MKYKQWSMVCLLVSAAASAAEITVPVNVAEKQGVGAAVGVVRIVETPYGLAFYPALNGLSPGLHGFHIHEYGDLSGKWCKAAGGHYNPKGKPHGGLRDPESHAGDLGNVTNGAIHFKTKKFSLG